MSMQLELESEFEKQHAFLSYDEYAELAAESLGITFNRYIEEGALDDATHAMIDAELELQKHKGDLEDVEQLMHLANTLALYDEYTQALTILRAILDRMLDNPFMPEDARYTFEELYNSTVRSLLIIFSNFDDTDSEYSELSDYLISIFPVMTMGREALNRRIVSALTKHGPNPEILSKLQTALELQHDIPNWELRDIREVLAEVTAAGDTERRPIKKRTMPSSVNAGKLIKQIQQAHEAKDYEELIELCREVIKHGEKHFAHENIELAYRRLQEAAQNTDNDELTIFAARWVYIHLGSNSSKRYDLLRRLLREEQWPEFVQGMIEELKQLDMHHAVMRQAEICIQEEDWKQLAEILKHNVSEQMIKLARQYLVPDHISEIRAMETTLLLEVFSNRYGRINYRHMCTGIEEFSNRYGLSQARILVEEVRNRYPKRRIMMEELDKFSAEKLSI